MWRSEGINIYCHHASSVVISSLFTWSGPSLMHVYYTLGGVDTCLFKLGSLEGPRRSAKVCHNNLTRYLHKGLLGMHMNIIIFSLTEGIDDDFFMWRPDIRQIHQEITFPSNRTTLSDTVVWSMMSYLMSRHKITKKYKYKIPIREQEYFISYK